MSSNVFACSVSFDAEFFLPKSEVKMMNKRIALVGIIVSNRNSVEQLNRLLSEYGEYIIGRMGIPYRERNLSIISIVMDAPNNIISSLSGKLGMLDGISIKTIYEKEKD